MWTRGLSLHCGRDLESDLESESESWDSSPGLGLGLGLGLGVGIVARAIASRLQDDNGRWNGIIGVLQRHEADLSVSAVTITYSRVSAVDFTLPFMHLGIAILMGKNLDEGQRGSQLFTFLEPLSFSVWTALLVSYLAVAFTMWLLARFSPYEWFDIQQIDRRDRSMDNHKNQFSILNSLWFAVGSLMQQGSDVIPRAAATRTVAVIWWMFTLIVISSYTAQLAAFLTVERMTTPIESAADLASQQRIRFGTLKNGSTMDFFRESKIPIHERMWSIMQSTSPTVFVNSSKEGIARVKAGNYAYMMESSMLEYYMGQDCQLQTIGGLLDSKGYGVALPKGSPLRNAFSKTILQLQERTILEALKNKWWKGSR
ncbi:ionotropic glutamate receptor GLR-4, partial [Aphelenchoides avenae]